MNGNDNPRKPILYYYLAVAAIVLLFNAFIMPGLMSMRVTQVDYGTFLREIENGNVKSVEIVDDAIGFVVVDQHGREQIYATGRLDDPDLVNRLYNADVEFMKVIPRENSPLVNFLVSWILPMLIFIGVGQFLMRRLQSKIGGMGNVMSFGKSNVKVYVEAQTGITFADVAGQDEAKEALQEVIDYLNRENIVDFKNKKVLITSAIDRFGLAESLEKTEAECIYGDVFYALGIPYFLHSLTTLKRIAKILLPIVRHLPFKVLYPTGEKENEESKENKTIEKIYKSVDIIAGDFLYIKQFMPERLDNKIIITNTITEANVRSLKEKGVRILITTTPEFNGRSFGTNVMEGVLITLAGKNYNNLTQQDYIDLLEKASFLPRIIYLNDEYKKIEEKI